MSVNGGFLAGSGEVLAELQIVDAETIRGIFRGGRLDLLLSPGPDSNVIIKGWSGESLKTIRDIKYADNIIDTVRITHTRLRCSLKRHADHNIG